MTKLVSRSFVTLACALAAIVCACAPSLAWAADTTVDVSFYKDNNTVAVELQNPVDIEEDVNALQLTLAMNATQGSMDGITPGFVFNTGYNASVKQARYNSSVDDLTIYVAGAEQNLLPENANLVLGWLVFNTVESASATFDVTVAQDSLSMVGSMRNPLPGEAVANENATARVTINGATVTVDAKDRPSPGSGGGGNGGTDNPTAPFPPGGFDPTNDVPEQYNGNGSGNGSTGAGLSQVSDLATPNADNLDPSASESADASVTSTSNVSPSVARAQRGNNSATADQGGLPVPAIVGIVAGVIVLAGLLFYFLYWRRRKVA